MSLNHYRIKESGIFMKDYLVSVTSAIRKVTKEVFLCWFKLNINDLEEIVKAAYNCERLVIGYCDIECSFHYNLNPLYTIF